MLKKEEGGRHTPFFNGYRPQFYFRTTDVTGTVTLPAGTEMVMPGDNIKVDVELVSPIACEEGLRFAIREGGKTVGAGVVTKILAERRREEGRQRPRPLLRPRSNGDRDFGRSAPAEVGSAIARGSEVSFFCGTLATFARLG